MGIDALQLQESDGAFVLRSLVRIQPQVRASVQFEPGSRFAGICFPRQYEAELFPLEEGQVEFASRATIEAQEGGATVQLTLQLETPIVSIEVSARPFLDHVASELLFSISGCSFPVANSLPLSATRGELRFSQPFEVVPAHLPVGTLTLPEFLPEHWTVRYNLTGLLARMEAD